MQVRKQQLELNMEQQTGSKSGKEYIKAVYCHPAYLTYMQSTSWENAGLDEAQAGIKIAGRNINNLSYADDTTLMADSEEELRSLLMKVTPTKVWVLPDKKLLVHFISHSQVSVLTSHQHRVKTKPVSPPSQADSLPYAGVRWELISVSDWMKWIRNSSCHKTHTLVGVWSLGQEDSLE